MRDIASIPFDTFNVFHFGLKCLSILNSDGATWTQFIKNTCKNSSNMFITVGRNSSNVLNFLFALNWSCDLGNLFHNLVSSHLNSSTKVHWVHSSSNSLASFPVNGACKNSSCGSSISSLVICLRGNLLNKTGTNIVVSVAKLDILSYSHSILGNFWSSECLVYDNISSSWTQSNLNCICQ